MNKVVFVPTNFKKLESNKSGMKKIWEEAMANTNGEVKHSDSKVDGYTLESDISSAIIELNSHGYEVVSITPITSGSYDFKYKPSHSGLGVIQSGSYGYGYGFSYTEGVIILARENSHQ
ncbi:hypothetical protein [Vibrio parahaemolyticus]|uniref:hypothetical protein n=1 Tax=Vibrio parahaemolyticus TaxID=670 RepID=UPI00235E4568|nr:hypothetical protein [Vibrio parahaemolyticus]